MIMKHLFRLVVFGVILLSSACTPKKGEKTNSDGNDSIQTTLVTHQQTKMSGEMEHKYSITMEYPVGGNEMVVKAVRQWLCEWITNGKYQGDLSQGDSLAKETCRLFFGEFEDTLVDNPDDILGEAYNHIIIKKTFETDKYVTFSGFQELCFPYNIHGNTFNRGMTFCKHDGSRLEWKDFRKEVGDKTLNALIIKYLMEQYFHVNTMEEFNDNLLLEEHKETFPYPHNQPVLEKEGVLIQYDNYEITGFGAGVPPSCVIPYQEIKPFLNESWI